MEAQQWLLVVVALYAVVVFNVAIALPTMNSTVRHLTPGYYVAHTTATFNVKNYGAKGNSGNDDTKVVYHFVFGLLLFPSYSHSLTWLEAAHGGSMPAADGNVEGGMRGGRCGDAGAPAGDLLHWPCAVPRPVQQGHHHHLPATGNAQGCDRLEEVRQRLDRVRLDQSPHRRWQQWPHRRPGRRLVALQQMPHQEGLQSPSHQRVVREQREHGGTGHHVCEQQVLPHRVAAEPQHPYERPPHQRAREQPQHRRHPHRAQHRVVITDTRISIGDDCISIGQGNDNIDIARVHCGPDHGMSVGSLGRYVGEGDVTRVHVRDMNFKGTMNGVRIKTWENSPTKSVAAHMLFENMVMKDVQNPIIIDQKYCPYYNCEHKYVSGVSIKDIQFKNIKGSSMTPVAVLLRCGVACQGEVLQDVDLRYKGQGGTSAKCENIKAKYMGFQNPKPCP